jgi:hypothetical protein
VIGTHELSHPLFPTRKRVKNKNKNIFVKFFKNKNKNKVL